MKPKSAANLAMMFAIIGWLLLISGVLSNMGDYFPVPPREVLARTQRILTSILFLGTVTLFAAAGLGGYALAHREKRAWLALAGCLAPPAYYFIDALIDPLN